MGQCFPGSCRPRGKAHVLALAEGSFGEHPLPDGLLCLEGKHLGGEAPRQVCPGWHAAPRSLICSPVPHV